MNTATDQAVRAAFDLGFAVAKDARARNPFAAGSMEFKAWQGARNQRKMTADAVRAWAGFTSLMVARGEVVLLQCSA